MVFRQYGYFSISGDDSQVSLSCVRIIHREGGGILRFRSHSCRKESRAESDASTSSTKATGPRDFRAYNGIDVTVAEARGQLDLQTWKEARDRRIPLGPETGAI